MRSHGSRRLPAAIATALMLVLAAGCGDADGVGSAADEARPTGVVAETTTTPAPSTDAGGAPLEPLGLSIPSDCPVPWEPVYAATESTYPVSVPTSEVPPERGESLDLLSRRFDPPDTDGDGNADGVGDTATSGETVVLSRADGDLLLAAEGGSVGSQGGTTWIGDLDGDGRDELLVLSSAEEITDGGFTSYPVYVVPGSTPNGRHDPAVVGVRLPVGSGAPVMPAGDQDGDGSDDVLLSVGAAVRVVSGAQIMAAGPGGAVDEVPAAMPGTPEGWVSGVVQLDPDQPPVLVLLADEVDDGVTLELWTQPGVVLTTSRVPVTLDGARGMQLTAYRSGEDRIVELASQMDRTGNSTAWAWNLDDPCAGPTPAG
jgi:hypothetical protein